MTIRKLFNYFLRGMLFVFPVFATFYIFVIMISWANSLFNNLLFDWLQQDIPGLGLITAVLIIILLGFFVTRAFFRPVFRFMEQLLEQIPLIKILYSALKDLTEAFVGDRKRFNRPVLVTLSDGVERIGFVTEENLLMLGIENRVAVYCPHSYNFSGNLFLVDPARVKPLQINPADAMKFAVSAGVTHVEASE
ncbi:MAG: DUF502 domain-containing protein [Balneolaceae bacterium]